MATVANTLNPAQTHSPFNLGKDLAPIALLGVVPNVLVANPSVPANNLDELIALAKSSPESLTFGSSGAGTASHMAAEMFNQKAGTKIVIVPYQGGSNQAVTDLLAGPHHADVQCGRNSGPACRCGQTEGISPWPSRSGRRSCRMYRRSLKRACWL